MGKKRGKSSSSSSHASKIQNKDLSEAFAAAISAMGQPVMMKVCRLCEAKDGPFLNIFDLEQGIAKKIDTLLPFCVTEYDDLPHNICFRCSAKIEELHEFVTKCIKAQENLRAALGKEGTFITKTRRIKLWEEKLKESNMSYDDVCDAIINQAMKGIADIPPSQIEESEAPIKDVVKPKTYTKTVAKSKATALKPSLPPTDSKPNIEFESCDDDDKPIGRKTRRSAVISDNITESPENITEIKTYARKRATEESPTAKELGSDTTLEQVDDVKGSKKKVSKGRKRSLPSNHIVDNCKNDKTPTKSPKKEEDAPEEVKKPFDINEHISTIKVNGVGVLYQCHLCNRNFLCKDIVQTHGCAKTGVPKLDFLIASSSNDPPKIPSSTVKYITSKPKVDSVISKKDEFPKEVEAPKEVAAIELVPKEVAPKSKPKIGPASRIKKHPDTGMPPIGTRVDPRELSPPPQMTSNNITNHSTIEIPALKNKFRLMPGPNNTFILVEDPEESQPSVSKHASSEQIEEVPKKKKLAGPKSARATLPPPTPTEIIDIDDEGSDDGPYPVGLFQTPHKSADEDAPLTFTTPAMKKHNYTVVQTGNPSKLLISAKPQATYSNHSKSKGRNKSNKDNSKSEPYQVTLEDATRPSDSKFLNVFNVDPLLQPSYVLPSNTIQESQISTSTPLPPSSSNIKDIYSCNWCPEKFSREKKLLSHIQSHFNAIDNNERKRRKS